MLFLINIFCDIEKHRRVHRAKNLTSRNAATASGALSSFEPPGEKSPKRRGRKKRSAAEAISSTLDTTRTTATVCHSSASLGERSETVETHSSHASGTSHIFVKRLKRFYVRERSADEKQQPAASPGCPTLATTAQSTGDPNLSTLVSGYENSDITFSNLPSLSSPNVTSAIANELVLDDAMNSSTAAHPDLSMLRGQPQPSALLQPLAPVSTISSALSGSSYSAYSVGHPRNPTTPSQTSFSGAGDPSLLAIPEVFVSTTIREPTGTQRETGVVSIVVVESRRALAPGVNLLLSGSNSVCSSMATPITLLPNEEMDQMIANLSECIRLVILPIKDDEASPLRQLRQSQVFYPLSGIVIS